MAESQEPRPPKTGFSPGGYLPRLWKAAPEHEDDSTEGKKKKKKAGANESPAKGKGKKARPGNDEDDGTRKGVLLEETPNLDTVEARRTARIIMGSVATLLLLIVGFVVVRIFKGSAEEPTAPEEPVVVIDVRAQRQRNETEARALVERAREVYARGNDEQARSMLSRVTVAYPGTKAAIESQQWLGRNRQTQKLFPDAAELEAEASKLALAAAAAKNAPVPAPPQAAPAVEKPPVQASVAIRSGFVPTYPEAALPANPPATATKPAFVPTHPEAAAPTSVPPPVASRVAAENDPGQASGPTSRPLPDGYQARSGVGVHPSGWPLEIFGGRDGSMMVLVPGNSFVMGRDGGEPAEAPAHPVRLSSFYIDKHEVTNRQFDQFVKDTGEKSDRTKALAREGGKVSLSEDSPVVMVSARDAREYADWVGKRLPTEAQWEMAARGTDHRPHPWGPFPPVWERPREARQIDPVMSFPSDLSPYGAYDMAGNALEWTQDWYDSKYYASLRGAISQDPSGPSSRPASMQVTVKGGSKSWIVSAREGMRYESRLPFLGFRCVLPVEGSDTVVQPAPPLQNNPGGSPRKKVVAPF